MSEEIGAVSTETSQSPQSAQVQGQVADVHAFIDYLKQFVPVLLDTTTSSNNSEFEKCLSEKTSVEIIKKFLSEAQIRTLIVQKFIIKGKLHGGFFPTRYSNLTLIYPDPYFWKFFGHILLN